MTDGLKQTDLTPCGLCGKGVIHTGNPMFYRVSVQSFFTDVRAVQRQHGLEMSMGGAAPLAQIMGPNEDMAVPVHEPTTALICMECALTASNPVAMLLERITSDDDQTGEKETP